jgi:hypothetical protein
MSMCVISGQESTWEMHIKTKIGNIPRLRNYCLAMY